MKFLSVKNNHPHSVLKFKTRTVNKVKKYVFRIAIIYNLQIRIFALWKDDNENRIKHKI
jgi:hypothetical protein